MFRSGSRKFLLDRYKQFSTSSSFFNDHNHKVSATILKNGIVLNESKIPSPQPNSTSSTSQQQQQQMRSVVADNKSNNKFSSVDLLNEKESSSSSSSRVGTTDLASFFEIRQDDINNFNAFQSVHIIGQAILYREEMDLKMFNDIESMKMLMNSLKTDEISIVGSPTTTTTVAALPPVVDAVELKKEQKEQDGEHVNENEDEEDESDLSMMNRNARVPRRANHGARPCSSVNRKKKRLRRHYGW